MFLAKIPSSKLVEVLHLTGSMASKNRLFFSMDTTHFFSMDVETGISVSSAAEDLQLEHAGFEETAFSRLVTDRNLKSIILEAQNQDVEYFKNNRFNVQSLDPFASDISLEERQHRHVLVKQVFKSLIGQKMNSHMEVVLADGTKYPLIDNPFANLKLFDDAQYKLVKRLLAEQDPEEIIEGYDQGQSSSRAAYDKICSILLWTE